MVHFKSLAVVGGFFDRNVVVVEVLFKVDGLAVLIENLHVKTQRLELLHHNLEGFGDTGLRYILTLDNGLIGLYAAVKVV